MTASAPAPEFAALIEAITAAWRAGDADAVFAFAADDPHVGMGGPGSALPMSVGCDELRQTLARIVRPLPPGAGVFPRDTRGYAIGDIGWLTCDAELRLPGQPPRDWFITMVLTRAGGDWRFVHFGALPGEPRADPG